MTRFDPYHITRRSAHSTGSKPESAWKWSAVCGMVLSELLLRTAWVAAQPPPPPAAPVVTVTRSWYLEAAIVVVMMGLALFAVCRSSRRN